MNRRTESRFLNESTIGGETRSYAIPNWSSLPWSTPRLGGRILEKSWSEPTTLVQSLHDWHNRVVDTCCILEMWTIII